MIADGPFIMGVPGITNSTAATASTNVYNAGAARTLFKQGLGVPLPWVWFKATLTADDNPTIKVDFVGSAAAALNSSNIVLGSSGVITTTQDGTTIASGEAVIGKFPVHEQSAAKQYYGCLFTLGGTNPDSVADADGCMLVWAPQTNMFFDN